MRLLSTAALSLALTAGLGLALPQGALAKKDDQAQQQQAAGPRLSASAKFIKPAKAVQDLLAAKNFDGALAAMPEAEAAASTPDDHYFIGNFYLNIGIGKQDTTYQRKGIEAMLASGKVAPADLAKIENAAGSLAANAKDMDSARKHFTNALAAGADAAQTEALIAETYFGPAYDTIQNGNSFTADGRASAIQGLPHLRKAIDAQVAAGTTPPLNWYERGFQTALVAQSPDAFDWAKLTLAQTNRAEDWRLAARMLQDNNKTMGRGATIDLLRLLNNAKALKGDYSYSELVEALWKAGLPGETKSTIDSGVAAGDIKQAQFADIYKLADAAIAKDKASLPAAATSAASAANGKLAASTGDAYFGYGDYAKAIELYRTALQKGGVDADEVNTHLGIALAQTGDVAGAKTAFAAVSGAPRKQIADLWTIWIGKPKAA